MLAALILAVLGPLPYLLVGCAIMTFCARNEEDWRLAPLLGCVSVAWITELGLISGIGGRWAAAALVILSLIVGCLRFPCAQNEIRKSLPLFGLIYSASLFLHLFVPYPAMFLWGGDWYETWRTALAVFENQFNAELLARTPLFGAGAVPLLWVSREFAAVQVFSIVVAAASLTVVLPNSSFRDRKALLLSICLVVITPFVLLHTAANWAKLFAAGCVVVSLRRASHATSLRDFIVPAAWLAMGVAAHQSSILFVPLLLVASFQKQAFKGRVALGHLAILAVCGIAIAGSFEAWVIARFGLHARVSHNPAITWRNGASFTTNTLLVATSTFTGWFPLAIWNKLRESNDLRAFSVWAGLGFYTLIVWVTNLAGTLAGHLLPLWLSSIRRTNAALNLFRDYSYPTLILAALVLAILGNSLLNPYASAVGAVQTGLTPISFLLLYLFLRVCSESNDLTTLRKAFSFTMLIAALPFLAASASVLLVFQVHFPFSESIREMVRAKDADFRLFTELGLSTIGSLGFPWLFPVGALLTGLCFRWLAFITPDANTSQTSPEST
jgi:hypothetical protein